MYGNDDAKRHEKELRAKARGETVRAEILAALKAGEPLTAAELTRQIAGDVTLTEVTFQVHRLAEEGRVVADDEEGPNRLA